MSYSENNSFEKIMNRMLANDELINIDKRVGSVIYDAIAPIALELSEAYAKMDILQEQTYVMTATGSNLDKRVYDYGISRTSATYAKRIAEFKKYKTDSNGNYVLDENKNKILTDMDISVGIRFTLPENSEITYTYTGIIDGYKILQCEQTGTKGNEYIGQILPLTPVDGLIEANIISTYEPAEDEETDDELRERTKEFINYQPYGGNISDYIEFTNAIQGVGQTKVFPAWQYNGSVLLSIVDPQYDPATDEFLKNVKNQIDPEENSGNGVGIAPIGHFVTVTTPTKKSVNVTLNLEIVVDTDAGELYEGVTNVLEDYLLSVRQQFKQNVRLAVYRSRIIERLLNNVSSIINVKDCLLNGEDSDIVYTDEGQIGMQYLPYVGEVTIE
jgi:uncharacterized phage protein gp47/JayE